MRILTQRVQDLVIGYLLGQPITDGSGFVQMMGLVIDHLSR
jgi:hypothetical protein